MFDEDEGMYDDREDEQPEKPQTFYHEFDIDVIKKTYLGQQLK
jgi:hypothetical protein